MRKYREEDLLLMLDLDESYIDTIPKYYLNNRDFILKTVKINVKILDYIPNTYKEDTDFIIKCIKQNGLALEKLSTTQKSEKNIVLAAVKQNGYALQYASNELKNDRDVVITAIKQNVLSYKYASNEMKEDYEINLIALKNIKENNNIFNEKIKIKNNESKYIEEQIKEFTNTYNSLDKRMKNSKEIIEFEMEDDATLYDYYEELFNYKKIGVLARVEYKGEYVYSDEYNIKNKLYEIEIKNHPSFTKYYDIILENLSRPEDSGSYIIANLAIEKKNLNYIVYVIEMIEYVKQNGTNKLDDFIKCFPQKINMYENADAYYFAKYYFYNYIDILGLIGLKSKQLKKNNYK